MEGTRRRSRGRTITEADLVLFSMLTRDWADIHIDSFHAAQTVFQKRIAHAGLSLAVASGLIAPAASDAPYGMSRIRFVTPAFLGDSVYVDLTRAQDRPSEHMRIVNQDGEVLVEAEFKLGRRTT